MNTTSRSILVSFATISLITAVGAAKAADNTAATRSLVTSSILATANMPIEEAMPGDTLESPGMASAESSEMLPAPVPSQSELVLSDGTVPIEMVGWGGVVPGPCCEVCGGGDCCTTTWYSLQEVRMLTCVHPKDIYTTGEMDLSGGAVFLVPRLSSGSITMDVSAGYSTAIGRYLGRDSENRDRFLEFSFWGLNEWAESRQANGIRLTDSATFPDPVSFGSLFTPFDLTDSIFDSSVGGFNRADTHIIRYKSEIDNYELNLRFQLRKQPDRLVLHPNGRWRRECQPGCRISYLFGVRTMAINEKFDLYSSGTITVGAVSSPVSGEYFSRTYNNLVGLQFGAELMQHNCRYEYGLRAKVCPCINFSSYNVEASNYAVGDPYAMTDIDFNRGADKDGAAFIGEFGFVGSYRVRPNLVLRASYDLMWTLGTALAPEQMVFEESPPAQIDANSTAMYHGLSLGIEWLR